LELQLRSIAKSYRVGNKTTEIVRDISLDVASQQFVSIIGPSGSGKSTLLHMIGGLTLPTSGTILINGQDVTGKRGLISYMPQNDSLFPWRTVMDNIILSQELAGISKSSARERAAMWLDRVGLSMFASAYPDQLSGGMRQRVSMLRTFLSPRELMCLDEPFAALDALTRLDMQQVLLRIWEETKRSALMITHSIEEALFLSDQVYVLGGNPTTVTSIFEVPFGRPREASITSEERFVRLKSRVYESLRRDANHSSQASVKMSP